MTWDKLCGAPIEGTKVASIAALTTEHAKIHPRGAGAIPDAATLGAMIKVASKLKLKAPTKKARGRTKGFAFNIALCVVSGGKVGAKTVYSEFVTKKGGAASCYENTVLPRTIEAGHILVHQGVAPCTRCRSGYRAWAIARRCTIVVECDVEYDKSGADATFVFFPTGTVLYTS